LFYHLIESPVQCLPVVLRLISTLSYVLGVLIRITILQKRPRESDTVNVTYNNDAVTEMVIYKSTVYMLHAFRYFTKI
jgi:hypothetical protein